MEKLERITIIIVLFVLLWAVVFGSGCIAHTVNGFGRDLQTVTDPYIQGQ